MACLHLTVGFEALTVDALSDNIDLGDVSQEQVRVIGARFQRAAGGFPLNLAQKMKPRDGNSQHVRCVTLEKCAKIGPKRSTEHWCKQAEFVPLWPLAADTLRMNMDEERLRSYGVKVRLCLYLDIFGSSWAVLAIHRHNNHVSDKE